jgi:hypothetical protein
MSYEIIVLSLGFFPAYKVVGKWLRNIPISVSDLSILGAWLIFSVVSGIFIAVFFFRKGVRNLQDSA